MPDLTTILLVVYGLGAAIGLVRTEAKWPARIALSLLWPLGLAAFLATVALLFVSLPIAFPVVGSIIFAIGVAVLLFMIRDS